MAARCVVAAVNEQFAPFGQSAVVAAHRGHLLARAAGAALDLSLRPEPNLEAWPVSAITSLSVLGFDPSRGRPLPPGLPHPTPVGAAEDGYFGPQPGAFDTVVSVFTACAVSDPAVWLRRIAMSLGPGGRLLLLEHVRAGGWTRLLQRAVSPVSRMAVGGCRLDLDLFSLVRRAGFGLSDGARWRVVGPAPLPVTPCVALVATRVDGGGGGERSGAVSVREPA